MTAGTLVSTSSQAQWQALQPARPATLLGAPSQPSFRTIGWDALIPAGWDNGLGGIDLRTLDDGDPRAAELMKKVRSAWDKAPVNMAMVGQSVRIAGYVVPLEQGTQGLAEFLLVPYFGACIHTPPPPSNQIIHVLPRSAAKGVQTMDTVWVSGVLKYARNDSEMGVSSWRVEAAGVQPYTGGPASPPPPR